MNCPQLKTKHSALITLLLLAGPALAQNEFWCDPNCVALYNHENGALGTDSIGGNDTASADLPTADTTDFKQGAASADFEADTSEWLQRLDAELSAGFPGKSGTTNTTVSGCFWCKPESMRAAGSYNFILSKWAGGATNQRSWAVALTNSVLIFIKGYNGGADYETTSYSVPLVAGTWYHVGFTYNDATGAVLIRIWDDDASAYLAADTTDTHTQSMSVDSGAWIIGTTTIAPSSNDYDGLLDEVVIFNDVLTADEIDGIRQQTRSCAAGQVIAIWED